MAFQFTPAAERALLAASGWECHGDEDLTPPAVLMGLLAEPECRAAEMLTRAGISPDRVCQRWPNLQTLTPDPHRGRRFSTALHEALLAAQERLVDYPRPLVLATEHVLLGLVASGDETARWLAESGLAAEALEAEVHRIHGHDPSPIKLDGTAEPALPAIASASPTVVESLSEARVAALRVIDAAANRAREGLRVVEDYVRFGLDDGHLTERLKRLRHELATAIAPVSRAERLAARETQADVGARIATPDEGCRAGAESIVAANMARVQEALRSLEEFVKFVRPEAAAACERLRYESYTVERAIANTAGSQATLAQARLYVLIDGRSSADEFERLVRALLGAGVDVLQLRDKQLDDRQLLERAHVLRAVTRGTSTLCVVNDRPDVAVLSRADGVHVGQRELTVKDARSIVGPRCLVGVSTHTLDEARQAVLDGANYLGCGPVFPSGTKRFASFPGLALLRAVAAEIRLPAFAIGGIDATNIGDVRGAGFTRVAVSAAVVAAADPAVAARALAEALRVAGG